MVDQDLFGAQAGPALDLKSDAAREAIASLRGYAYQALVTRDSPYGTLPAR